jgi:hypothetical protein
MGGYIKRDVERVKVAALNTKVNKEVFDAFKDCCKRQGYPLNVMLETFMNQYAHGNFRLDDKDIMKFKDDGHEESVLNTTFNKEIYTRFKSACKGRGYFVKYVITAFMEQYAERNLVLEYVDMTEEE